MGTGSDESAAKVTDIFGESERSSEETLGTGESRELKKKLQIL